VLDVVDELQLFQGNVDDVTIEGFHLVRQELGAFVYQCCKGPLQSHYIEYLFVMKYTRFMEVMEREAELPSTHLEVIVDQLTSIVMVDDDTLIMSLLNDDPHIQLFQESVSCNGELRPG
jgi:uncharacterized membrane protein YidH (DUF202 family)